MYADRNKTGLSPAAMGAALAINAGLFAVLLSLSPDIIKIVHPPIETYPVPADPTPPPPPQKPQPKKPIEAKPRPQPDPTPPRTVIDPPLSPNNPTYPVDPPLQPPSTEVGTGTGGTVPVDPPKAPPVMIDARPDPNAAFQPDYPPDMRRDGTEGTVRVRVLIGTDGRVKAVELVSSPSASFFNVTKRQALSKWRFKPATVDGVAVEKWRTMTLQFHLTDA